MKESIPEISMMAALDYELRSRPWIAYVSWPWMQDMVSVYIAGVVRRKYRRYRQSRVEQQSMMELRHER